MYIFSPETRKNVKIVHLLEVFFVQTTIQASGTFYSIFSLQKYKLAKERLIGIFFFKYTNLFNEIENNFQIYFVFIIRFIFKHY